MATPKDEKLYDKAKAEADKTYKKPSAYKSGFIVKRYKELYKEKYGSGEPYEGGELAVQSQRRSLLDSRDKNLSVFYLFPPNPHACYLLKSEEGVTGGTLGSTEFILY